MTTSDESLTVLQVDHPEVEFLLLADYAEGLQGKLYVMGGGWDRRGVLDFNQPQNFSVAVAVLVPWNDTNRPIPLALSIHADGVPVGPSLRTQVTAGRPAQARAGQKLRFIFALNYTNIVLPGPGEYEVEASVDAGASRRVSFFAEQVPGQSIQGAA